MNALRLSVLITWIGLASLARAAGFDCARAGTPVEKLVCADAILSQADEDLAQAYGRAMAQARQAGAVREAQRRWLAQDRNRCSDLACLRASYARSLAALQAGRRGSDPDVALCEQVAEHARRGILDKLLVARVGEQPLSMLGDVAGEPGVGTHLANFWDLDLDGDSVIDRLVIDVQGTMNSGTVYARSGRAGAPVVMLETGDIDQRVLKIGARGYVLSDGGLPYSPWTLWRLLAREGFVPVCTVMPRRGQRIKLTAGWGYAACEAALDDGLGHIEFDFAPSVAPLPPEPRFRSMSLSGGVAQVDIDNDGTDEQVYSVRFDSGAGRGCSGEYLAVANQDGRHVPDTWLNQQLLGGLALTCDSDMELAWYGGVTYVDVHNDTGDRTLYRIESQQVTPMCEFREAPDYDVPVGLSKQSRREVTSPP